MSEHMIGTRENPEELINEIVTLRKEYENEYKAYADAQKEGEFPKEPVFAYKYAEHLQHLMLDVLFFGTNGNIGYDDVSLAQIVFGYAMITSIDLVQKYAEMFGGISKEKFNEAYQMFNKMRSGEITKDELDDWMKYTE